MTSINFASYPSLNTYVIVAGTEITTAPPTTISGGTAFYGVSPAAESSITGIYTGGIRKTTAETGPAQTELGTTSDSTTSTLMGAIKSLVANRPKFDNLIPTTFTSDVDGAAAVYQYIGLSDLNFNAPTTFSGPGQIVIRTNPTININFTPGFSMTLSNISASNIYFYSSTQINDTAGTLSLYGIFTAGTLISLKQSTIVTGNLYSNAAVTLIGNTINPETICYLKGTKILTENGYTNVEDLKVGDNIVTKGSIVNNEEVVFSESEFKPIKWISNFYAGRRDASDLPVCFKAGSLNENLPENDLYVSPGHRVIIDGKMVIACDAVNGDSIVQSDEVGTIEYFHFELDCHSVIVAEGVLSETFLELNDSKRFFQK